MFEFGNTSVLLSSVHVLRRMPHSKGIQHCSAIRMTVPPVNPHNMHLFDHTQLPLCRVLAVYKVQMFSSVKAQIILMSHENSM